MTWIERLEALQRPSLHVCLSLLSLLQIFFFKLFNVVVKPTFIQKYIVKKKRFKPVALNIRNSPQKKHVTDICVFLIEYTSTSRNHLMFIIFKDCILLS